jgi:hypothetical protein
MVGMGMIGVGMTPTIAIRLPSTSPVGLTSN